ncbi:MAG: hypothetical protein R3B45_02665 [Bdellovibrionota bacterium]
MAKLIQSVLMVYKKLYWAVLILLSFYPFIESGIASELNISDELSSIDSNHPDAINAFRSYWRSFDSFEDVTIREGEKRYKESLQHLNEIYEKEEKISIGKQLEFLRKSVQAYRKQLLNNKEANNRPYVLLNLSQVLSKIGFVEEKGKIGDLGVGKKNEALTVLSDLIGIYPDFKQIESAQYLQAVILSSLNQKQEALVVWQNLANKAEHSIYGVNALVFVGDYYFNSDENEKALLRYKRALQLLSKLDKAERIYETIRIQYRIAWAAYRSAKLEIAINTGIDMLQPGSMVKNNEKRKLIETDAVELIGDSLFDQNNFVEFTRIVKKPNLLNFSTKIGLRTLSRYINASIYSEAEKIGDFLVREFPLSKETPVIYTQLAMLYEKMSQPEKRVGILERLALLLPKQSLWRTRHKVDYDSILMMEKLAINAAKIAAIWHYEKGLATGNQKRFSISDSFYSILLDFDPSNAEAINWRLRRAHCYYFSDNLETAVSLYTELIEQYKVSKSTLQIASYQLVIAYEKLWRQKFAKAVENGIDLEKDKVTLALAHDLEQAAKSYSNKFPNEARSIDVLLIAANAFRDQGKYGDASKMWQRVLVSSPNESQRGLAIRGLIFASMKDGSTRDVIQVARKFLKLEDWNKLGRYLNNELKSVLSVAAIDEGKRLNQDGKLLEAGKLLVSLAQDFPSMPNQERIYRDGAYLLAISGQWNDAAEAARKFLATDKKTLRGDMIYLLGRANEYQIRFAGAASSYLLLASSFPKHSRAKPSLLRSEKLFLAEDNYTGAAKSAEMSGDLSQDRGERLAFYEHAIKHAIEGHDWDLAEKVVKKRFKVSNDASQRLKSRIYLARVLSEKGKDAEALKIYKDIALQSASKKGLMDLKTWTTLIGESNLSLAEEARDKFDDFDIWERSGPIDEKISYKAKYFAELSAYYQKCIELNDPIWSTQARYRLAEASDKFAEDIAGLMQKNAKLVTIKSQQRYMNQVKRLREIARRQHSQNILVKNKNPSLYYRNDWIRKSAFQLGGKDAETEENKFGEQLSPSISFELPNQWSL